MPTPAEISWSAKALGLGNGVIGAIRAPHRGSRPSAPHTRPGGHARAPRGPSPIPFAAAIVAANLWYRDGARGPDPETTRARLVLAVVAMLLAAGVVRFMPR